MNEDQMQRIQQSLAEDERRERERRRALRREVLIFADRDAAISAAARVIALGTIPSVAWLLLASVSTGWKSVFQTVFGIICFLVPFPFVTTALGVICGLFSDWWFADSPICVKRAAIAMALLLDSVLFAWVIVLSQ